MPTFDDFMQLDIRVGEVIRAEVFEKAKKPAYKLWVDFGEAIGVKAKKADVGVAFNVGGSAVTNCVTVLRKF